MTALAKHEASRLGELEATVERGLEAFVKVGEALREIRGSRLYRESHETFEAYCTERWGFGRNYANKQIAAAEVASGLGTGVPKLGNEAQARELARLDDETARRNAWNEATGQAAKEDRPVTASDVRRAVEQRRSTPTPPPKPEPPKPEPPEPEPEASPPPADQSPAERFEQFAAGCHRQVPLAHSQEVEAAVQERPADASGWRDDLANARDALDMLIERLQRANGQGLTRQERDEARAVADQAGIEELR